MRKRNYEIILNDRYCCQITAKNSELAKEKYIAGHIVKETDKLEAIETVCSEFYNRPFWSFWRMARG